MKFNFNLIKYEFSVINEPNMIASIKEFYNQLVLGYSGNLQELFDHLNKLNRDELDIIGLYKKVNSIDRQTDRTLFMIRGVISGNVILYRDKNYSTNDVSLVGCYSIDGDLRARVERYINELRVGFV